MKLNIYDKKEIIKTYETGSYKLMFGTLEDLVDAIDFDKLTGDSEAEVLRGVIDFINNSRETAKNLLKDMFDGLTDEELRNVAVDEMAACLVDAIKYVFTQIKKATKRKN